MFLCNQESIWDNNTREKQTKNIEEEVENGNKIGDKGGECTMGGDKKSR